MTFDSKLKLKVFKINVTHQKIFKLLDYILLTLNYLNLFETQEIKKYHILLIPVKTSNKHLKRRNLKSYQQNCIWIFTFDNQKLDHSGLCRLSLGLPNWWQITVISHFFIRTCLHFVASPSFGLLKLWQNLQFCF